MLKNTRNAELRTKRTEVQVKILFHKFILAGDLQMPTRIAHLESSIPNPFFLLKVQCSTFDVECSPPLHLSRELYKSNLFLQNKANSYHGFGARGSFLSVCNITRYVNVCPSGLAENERKNEPKRTQNEPNFSPILASFSRYWLCFSTKIAVKWHAEICFICLPFVARRAKKGG